MNSLPVTLQAQLDSSKATRSLDSLVNKRRDIFLNAKIDVSSLNRAQKALGAISGSASEFEKSMAAANARVLAFGTSVGVIEGMRRSFLALIKTTAEVENALVKISSVSEDSLKRSGVSIDQLSSRLFQIARETGQSFAVVGEAALEFSRQGLEVAETLKRTKDALILARLSGLDATASVEALTAAYNTFKNQVSGTNEILQKLVAVDNASAASMADLAQGIQRVGSIAQNVGQDINEVVASIAVLQEATARGGSVIGNSFKTILERAQRLENLKLFESLGVDTSFEGKVKPTIQLLQDLAKITSDPAFTGNKTGILRQLAGNFQINQLSAFLDVLTEIGGEANRYEQLLNTSRQASNEATKQNEKFSQTLVAGLNEADVALQELTNSFGKAGIKDPFSGFVSSFTSAVDSIKNVIGDDGFTGDIVKGIAKGFGGALFSAPVIVLAGLALTKIAFNFFKFARDAGRDFLQLNQSTKEQEKLQLSINQIISSDSRILSGITNTEQGRLLLTQRIADAYERQMVAAAAISQLTKNAASGAFNQGFRITQEGVKKTGRAADGFLPSLVRDEAADIKKGVGGASPNSKVVIIPDFPFGNGEKGLMVANSSEKFVKTQNGYAVLNPDMQGERAASGFLSGDIRRKAGVSGGGQKIKTSVVESTIEVSVKAAILAGKSLGELAAVVNKSIKGFELNRETFARVSKEGNRFASGLYKQNQEQNKKAAALVPGSVSKLSTSGTGFTPSVAGTSGLGFRNPGKREGPNRNPFAFVSDVYNTPEVFPDPSTTRLERERQAKVIKDRLAIDNQRRREKQAEAKKLLDERKFLQSKISGQDIAIGQFGGKKTANAATVKNIAKDREIAKQRLQQIEKELFENRGIDPSSIDRTRISDSQRASNDALKARLQANRVNIGGAGSLGGGGSSSSRSASGLSAIDARTPLLPIEAEKTRKTWQDSLGKFAILSIAMQGLSSAFEDAQGLTAKFSGFLGQSIPSLLIFKELGDLGGKSFGDVGESIKEKVSSLLENFGGGGGAPPPPGTRPSRTARIGRSFSNFRSGFAAGREGIGSGRDFAEFGDANNRGRLSSSRSANFGRNLGRLTSGAISAGRTAINFLPVVGQVALGLNILYEGIKIFKPDLFESVRLAFGGLTKSAQRAGEDFNNLSKELFDVSGKFTGKTNEETLASFRSRISEISASSEARRRKIDTSGKNAGEVQTLLFEKNIRDQFKNFFTGGESSVSGGPLTAKRADTVSTLSQSAQDEIFVASAKLAAQQEDVLKSILVGRGDEKAKNANPEELRKKIVSAFLFEVFKGIQGSAILEKGKTNEFFESEGGVKFLQEKALSFRVPEAKKEDRTVSGFETLETAENLFSVASREEAIRKSITSNEEKLLNIRSRLYYLSENETLENEKSLKNLELRKKSQEEYQSLIDKTFNKAFEEAQKQRQGGEIPINDLENALAIRDTLSTLDKSSSGASDAVFEITKSLLGSDTAAESLTREYKKSAEELEKSLKIDQEKLSTDLEIQKTVRELNKEYERQLSIAESQRSLEKERSSKKVADLQFEIDLIEIRKGSDLLSDFTRNLREKDIIALKSLQTDEKISENNAEAAKKQVELTQAYIRGEKSFEQFTLEQTLLLESLGSTNDELERQRKLLKATQDQTEANTTSAEDFAKAQREISKSLNAISLSESKKQSEIGRLNSLASDPSAGILTQEENRRKANEAQISLLENEGRRKIEENFKLARNEANKEQNEGEKRKLENDAETAKQLQTEEINREIKALRASTKEIGAVRSSLVSLDDAILQFSRGLGESRGQNQFNLLQATDPSSIAQGLIGERVYDEVGNRQGAELVSFIAQQNALLNEQFKIKTAASETERLELQRSYDLTNELIQIRNSGLDPIREQAALEKAINDNLEKRRTFGAGVEDSTAGMRDRIQSFNADFGRTATDGFKDALSGAIKAAVSETTNLKDALLDVALQFANSLRDKAIDNLADVFTNSLFGKGGSSGGSSGNIVSSLVGAVGGLFKGYASGGQVTGGSGTKDDVPTLLMGGEYVIPKNVVQSYGKGFFDRLRDGSIGKMAQGGYFAPGVRGQGTISGKENLLDFATQTATSGKGDIISSLGVNAGLVSLEPESLRLSNFARFGDSPILQATQETKEQAFGLYLDQLSAEKEYQKYLDDLKKAEKEKTKQFWISLAVAAVGAGVGAYANGAGASAGAKAGTAAKAATSTAGNQRYYDVATGLLKSTAQGYSSSRTSSPSSGFNSSLSAPNNIPQFEWREMMRQFSSQISNYGSSFGGNPLFNGINTSGRYNGRGYNSGGAVSGNGDTVPAMLSNKEFVLNSSAAQKIGYKDLYAMNSGANPSGGESETRIVAKLDELIEKTIGASNISVNVSMTNSGENNQQDNSQQSDSNASERQRFLTQRLKDTVIGVLREEQRPGGLLTSTRR